MLTNYKIIRLLK